MPSKEELLEQLERKLAIIRRSATTTAVLQAQRTARVEDIDRELGEEMKLQTAAVDDIKALLEDKEARGIVFTATGKTLRLMDGDIELVSSTSLVIDDAPTALAWLRRKHLFRRFTRTKDPELDKVKLKKEPNVLEKMPGVHLETTENLTVNVPGISDPFKRMLGGFKRILN